MRSPLTQQRLRECLDYNPETGAFTRKIGSSRSPVGSVVGNPWGSTGYLCCCVDAKRYSLHRLAWFYVHGMWPPNDVDHINGVKTDNRLTNLRCATRSQNMRNMGPPRHNTSGFKGVCFDKMNGKWLAYIQIDRKIKNLGRFETIEEARDAYARVAIERFGEFARLPEMAKRAAT